MRRSIQYNREVTVILCTSLAYDHGSLFNALATVYSFLTTTFVSFSLLLIECLDSVKSFASLVRYDRAKSGNSLTSTAVILYCQGL